MVSDTTLQDLNSRLQLLEGQLPVKDEALKSLTASNAALGDHLKQRWGALQALSGAVALLLAVTFGYQIFKTDELRRLGDKLEAKSEELDRQTAGASELCTALAASLSRLNNGYREGGRGEWALAREHAEAAVRILERARAHLSEAEIPNPEDGRLTPPRHSFVTALSPAYVAALELEARASFYLQENDNVLQIVDRILEVDADAWEAFHFKGIALGTLFPNDESIFEQEKAAYLNSFKIQPNFNKDRVNLAEAFASRGFLRETFSPVEHYLNEHRGKPDNAFLIVAKAYYAVGKFASTGNEKVLAEFEATLRDFQGSFVGNFDFTVVRNVVEKLRNPPEKSHFCDYAPGVRERIARTLEALLQRSMT